jgi:quercetin dioxygenase-like cupin family protein
MPALTRRPLASVLAACALATAAPACGGGGSDHAGKGGKPEKNGKVVRTALGSAVDASGAPGETLGLWRVVIPPGGEVPLHYHPGTQVAYVDKGVLTYTVTSGSVEVMRGAPGEHPTVVRRIGAGQTGTIAAGQWIVERRPVVHRGANRSSGKVVVVLATLLRNGAPPAVPVAHAGQ